ncbi:hypothetical protein KY334_07070 [Candidatus Woesearchaeota archaeon]|nr:hypothetical protein [Candidatus Woesearchaeota archaeon]
MELENIKTTLQDTFQLTVQKIQWCGLSAKQHVELEIACTDPPQQRPEVTKFLEETYPKMKFRQIYYRS